MTSLLKRIKAVAWAVGYCIIFSLLASTHSLATTYTFTGDGFWDEESHWSPSIPPDTLPSGSDIIITSDCVLTNNLTLEAGSTLTVNANRDLNVNILDITNSGTIYMFGSINSDDGFVFTNNISGLFINEGIIFAHGILDNAGIIRGNGRWIVSGLGNINTGTFRIDSSGEFNIESDSSAFENSGTFIIEEMVTLNNGGTFSNNSTLQIDGTFSNGEMYGPSGTLINNGVLKGNGILDQIGTFTNNTTGTLAPGASPGKLTVTGDLNLGNGTYDCEINGTVQGDDYDWLDVSGTLTIGANSKLNIVFGYTPTMGATFDFITASTISGSFSAGNITISGGGIGSVNITPVGNSFRMEITSLLPVELARFTAKEQNNQVLLNWMTASEQNNRGFEVQRSSNGKNWDVLGFVAGNGSTTAIQQYVYLDEIPLAGLNYYRLRQMDFDGISEYSPIATTKIKRTGGTISFYPNPASDKVNITINNGYEGKVVFTLYNALGESIKSQTAVLDGRTNYSNIGLAGQPSGIYWLEILTGNERWQMKLIIK